MRDRFLKTCDTMKSQKQERFQITLTNIEIGANAYTNFFDWSSSQLRPQIAKYR